MPGINPNNQPFYVAPQDPFALELIDLKREYKFVRAARGAAANPVAVYTLAHDEVSEPLIQMIARTTFDGLMAGVDPALSLSPLVGHLQVPVVATAVRLVEFYHIILGLGLFPGQEDPGHEYIDTFGFQLKILEEGQRTALFAESLIAAAGGVTATHPIVDNGTVAAFKLDGSPLTINSIDPTLGVVSLNDGMSPITDGTPVELAYGSTLYVVVDVVDVQRNNIPAVMLTKELVDYLQANQI